MNNKRLLEGVRVVDITLAYAGPFAAMHLADQGADVIKVEPIGGEQTRAWGPYYNNYGGYFAYINRNKRGIALDLKSPEGKEALMKLIATADVLVQNMRVGTLAKLGFSYEEVKKVNPKIIYASISGFGLEGPMADRPTYDMVAQAESGMMSVCGVPETGPLKVGPSIADSYTGTYLAIGIAMALYNRERTGEGIELDCAMVDTMFASLEGVVPTYTLNGKVLGTDMIRSNAYGPWDTFKAKDGYFVINCGTPKHFALCMEAIGRPELVTDPRFETMAVRADNYWGEGGLKSIIEDWSREKTRDEVEAALYGAGVPFGKVKTAAECAESEQTKVRHMMWEVDDPGFGIKFRMPGTPIKFHGRPDEPRKAAPLIGEDNDEVLTTICGYTQEEVDEMRKKGVIQ